MLEALGNVLAALGQPVPDANLSPGLLLLLQEYRDLAPEFTPGEALEHLQGVLGHARALQAAIAKLQAWADREREQPKG